MSRQRLLEQERATSAWKDVSSVSRAKSQYAALARGAPADIQISGLGQTLAFWQAKGKDEHIALYRHVSNWVLGQLHKSHNRGLLGWVMEEASSQEYRQATAEALAYLGWLKRFAEAEFGGNQT